MSVVRHQSPDVISWQEVNAGWWQSRLFRELEEYGVVRGDEDAALVEKARKVCDIAREHPGKLPLEFAIKYPADTVVTVTTDVKVRPDESLLDALSAISRNFGYRSIPDIYLEKPEPRKQFRRDR